VLHEGTVTNGRIKCIFSRVVSVIPGSEASDLNLNNSYYIMIGTGLFPGGYSVKLLIGECTDLCIL